MSARGNGDVERWQEISSFPVKESSQSGRASVKARAVSTELGQRESSGGNRVRHERNDPMILLLF